MADHLRKISTKMVPSETMTCSLSPDAIARRRYWFAKQRIDELCRRERDAVQNNELNRLWVFARDFEHKEEELHEPARKIAQELFRMKNKRPPERARWEAKPKRRMLD